MRDRAIVEATTATSKQFTTKENGINSKTVLSEK